MSAKQFILRSYKALDPSSFGAKFFKADLHFHTPASSDARGANRYGYNPYAKGFPTNVNKEVDPDQIRPTQDRILAESTALAKQIVAKFQQEGLSLVAVTDHNSIGTLWNDHEAKTKQMDLAAPTWYELIDSAAEEARQKDGAAPLTILPGIEISTNDVHILGVFRPEKPRRKIHFMICDLLSEIGFDIDKWGINDSVGSASVADTIDQIVRRGGIAIPAHIDGKDKAVLKLYKLTGGAMKRVLRHPGLSGVEIVRPKRFERYEENLKKTLKHWIDDVRHKAGRTSLAYLQGSDAHELKRIGKRHAYLKMTRPSFSGLRTALEMPSSRVRISGKFKKSKNGLYVYGLSVDDNYFGERDLRLNRHLNCVTGKKGAGKTKLYHLMQSAVLSQMPQPEGKVALLVEKVKGEDRTFYAFYREKNQVQPSLFQVDAERRQAAPLDMNQARQLKIIPKFYKSDRIDQIIRSKREVHDFIKKYFGNPSAQRVQKFNRLFAISRFLEQEAEPLLELAIAEDRYRLSLNVNWGRDKKRMKTIFSLSHSMRKTALMCIIIIMNEFGPAIIDAPENDFDNSDIINFLVPIIKLYKDSQQIILFTNNAIFSINTDPDNYILLDSSGTRLKEISQGFAIDDKEKRSQLIDIVEGGLKSFQDRATRYGL